MSTALSWTELRSARRDLAALLAFRTSALTPRSRRRLRLAGAFFLLLTIAAAVGPAYVDEEVRAEHGGSFVALLPALCLGFLFLGIFTAVASAGGREVLPRDQAVAFPVSATTDHLGALLLAPLNIAWAVQAWTLLGITSYALGPDRIWAYQVPVVLWVLAATAIAQVAGWLAEGVRRGPHGILLFRGLVALLALAAGLLVVSGHLAGFLDHSPTRGVLSSVLAGPGRPVGLLAPRAAGRSRRSVSRPPSSGPSLRAGRCVARCARSSASSRAATPRDRRQPRTSLMMLRIDRAGVWRSVPLRRGIMVLALMPGAVAVAGNLEWQMLTVLPGLVASGAHCCSASTPGASTDGVRCGARACRSHRGSLSPFAPSSCSRSCSAPRWRRSPWPPCAPGGPPHPRSRRSSARRSWSPRRWWPRACAGASRAPSPWTCAVPGPRLLHRW